MVLLDDLGAAEEAEDAGRGAEGGEHDGEAGVLVGVGDGFAAGAGAVDVGYEVGVEHGEVGGGEALGGYVYVGAVGWGGGGEEDGLAEGPGGEVFCEGWVDFHCGECFGFGFVFGFGWW